MTARRMKLPLDRSRPIMAIGDVHGMTAMLEAALEVAEAHRAFPILLGDLIDKGPDSVGVLRLVLPRLKAGTMAVVRGNHEERLLKWITKPGRDGKRPRAHAELMAETDASALAAKITEALERMPYWISLPGYVLAHGAFHPHMLTCPSKGHAADAPSKLKHLALYAEVDGKVDKNGLPIRTYNWIERIPGDLTVLVGHDTRQMHEPMVVDNKSGGKAVFLDTGAAKGGRLSSWLIPPL